MRNEWIKLPFAALAAAAVTVAPQPLAADTWGVVVPNGLATLDGNSASRLPFAYLSPVHYQQVYSASAFSDLPPGGAFLTLIRFRADCSSVRGWVVNNIAVSLSTTSVAPDQMSLKFDSNHGTDRVAVFAARQYFPPASPAGCPSSFDAAQVLRLSVPFFYNPSKGNLLLDLQHRGIDWTGGDLSESLTDTHDLPGDAVSRIVSFSLSSETAESTDSAGMVTHFQFYPAPALTNQIVMNDLVLTWPFSPSTFRLQHSGALGTNAGWDYYPGPIEYVGWWQAKVPLASLTNQAYFRLYWDTPQPLGAVGVPEATPEVCGIEVATPATSTTKSAPALLEHPDL